MEAVGSEKEGAGVVRPAAARLPCPCCPLGNSHREGKSVIDPDSGALQELGQVGVWDPEPFPGPPTSAKTKKPDGNFCLFPCLLFLDAVLIPGR